MMANEVVKRRGAKEDKENVAVATNMRTAANSVEQQILSVNEKLLSEIFTTYMDKNKGMLSLYDSFSCFEFELVFHNNKHNQ